MSFLQGCLDFLTEKQGAHMGSFQYVNHAGMRNGHSVSGAKLWAEIEATELNSTEANIFSAEETLLRVMSHEIQKYLPETTPVLELGTGTSNAFRKKTLLVMMALRSLEYICVDESDSFLQDLVSNQALSGFKINPILDNFFESNNCYFSDKERSALICMFGSTIGNIIAPLRERKPKEELISTLALLAKKINKGWLLVSFDANQDGESLKEYYSHHTLFHLNVLDRMAIELPITGDFDPCAFDYEPIWISSSGQLAHMAVVQRDMNFVLDGQKISLKKGQKLHLKNSFKYSPAFFERCCAQAGLSVIKRWSDASLTNVILLRKIPNFFPLSNDHKIIRKGS